MQEAAPSDRERPCRGRCFARVGYGAYEQGACKSKTGACKLRRCGNFALCGFQGPELELYAYGGFCLACQLCFEDAPRVKIGPSDAPCLLCAAEPGRDALELDCGHAVCCACFRGMLPREGPADIQDFGFRMPRVSRQAADPLWVFRDARSRWMDRHALAALRFLEKQGEWIDAAIDAAEDAKTCHVCRGDREFAVLCASN